MLASGHFQDAIVPPTDVDILVLILWSRLGTALPPQTAVREYVGLDGRSPVTGTEWEFESALAAHRAAGAPDLLAYRRTGDPGASLSDPVKRGDQERQWIALERFWHRHFEDVGLFIAGSSRYDTIDEFERKLTADLTALIGRRAQTLSVLPTSTTPRWLKGSPFRGLTAYDFESAPVFFGRDAAIAQGISRLARASDKGAAFLLVTGPSGSGKSSLASAGLLPALTAPKAMPGIGAWRRVVFRPGTVRGPIGALAEAILQGGTDDVGLPEFAYSGATAASIEAHLRAAHADASLPLLTVMAGVAQKQKGLLAHERVGLVILVDQLEEIATSPTIAPAERAMFFQILLGLARSGSIFVIATLRGDFWQALARDRSFLDLVEAGERLDLTAPDLPELSEMIRRPAEAAGLTFEIDPDTGLPLDAILAGEAGREAGALPMLSVCLDDLYRRDVERTGGTSVLSIASWRAIGGLRAAIHHRAEEILETLARTDPDAAASLPTLLRAAVTAGASVEAVTARAVPLSMFAVGTPGWRLINAFLAPEARLLVAEDRGTGPEVRVAHEALITDWRRAREWIRDNRRDIETEALLAAMMRRYEVATLAEKPESLIEGLNLEQGLDLLSRGAVDGEGPLGRFIEVSRINTEAVRAKIIEKAADEATAKLRLRRRFQMAVLAGVALFAIGVLAMVAQTKANRARLATAQAERAAEIARIETQEAGRQAAAATVAEKARAQAEDAQKRAEEANKRAATDEQKALASLTDAQKSLVTSLVAQTDLDLSNYDVVKALGHALKAAETERAYAKPGQTEVSDAAILKVIARNRQVLYLKRKSSPWGWPFAFLDDHTLVYALGTGWVVAVDLATDTKVWSVHLDGLEHPSRMTYDASHDTLAISGDQSLFLFNTKSPALQKHFTFKDDINWFDMDRDGGLIAVAFDHATTIFDPSESTAPAMTPIAPDLRNNVLVRVVFDRSGSNLYIIDRNRILDMEVDSGKTHEISLAPSSDIPQILSKARDLDAYGKDDQSLIFMSDLTFGIVNLAKGSLTDLKEQLTKSLNASNQTYAFPVAFHYPDQSKGNSGESLYAITRSGDQDVLQFGIDLVAGTNDLVGEQVLHIVSREFEAHAINHCRVSAEKGYLACTYSQVSKEGLLVWRLSSDGAGPSAVPRTTFNQIDGAARDPQSGRVLLIKGGDLVDAQKPGQPLIGRVAGWRIVALSGPFAVLDNASTNAIMAGTPDVGVMTPLHGRVPILDAKGRKLYRIDDTSVVAFDLATGRELWRRALDDAPVSLILRKDRLIAVSAKQAIVLATGTGAVLRTATIVGDGSAVLAVDSAGRSLAYRDVESSLRVVDLEDGTEKILNRASGYPTALAFSSNDQLIFVGGYDGIVTAWRFGQGPVWRLASPLGVASVDRPSSDFLDFVRAGEVLNLFPSPDGRFVGIRRAGDDSADLMLHATDSGHEFMRIKAPFKSPNATVAQFDSDNSLFVDWGPRGDLSPGMTDVSVATLDHVPQGGDEILAAGKALLKRLGGNASPESPSYQP